MCYVCAVSVRDLNSLESEFCFMLDFNMGVNVDTYEHYRSLLMASSERVLTTCR